MQQIERIDKRLDHRRLYIAEIRYSTDHTNGKGYTRDISFGGVFVTADRKIPLGTDIQAIMSLPKSPRRVSLRGTVVRITADGFAIAFKRREQRYFQDSGEYWQIPWTAA